MFKNKRSENSSANTETNDARSNHSYRAHLQASPTKSSLKTSSHNYSENALSSGSINTNAHQRPTTSSTTNAANKKKRVSRSTNPEVGSVISKARLSATVNKKFINEDGNFQCTLCPYISKYITHFEMHMKHSHPGVPIFLCEICGFETKAKNYLTVHVMNHLGLKPYKCSECDYASPRKEYLDLHLKRHFKVYCFQCIYCPYTTYRQDYLARHVSEKH